MNQLLIYFCLKMLEFQHLHDLIPDITKQNKYEDMKKQIDDITRLGKMTQELRKEHKGFQDWDLCSNKRDHQAIVQVIHIALL